MRDPLAPLPSPSEDPSYWECTVAPRTTQALYPEALTHELRDLGEEHHYEPLRLLGRNLGDTHGIDRRTRRRHNLGGALPDDHGSRHLVSAGHRPLRQVLGLASAHGWALVHTLSLTSTGVLLHVLDLLRRDLDPALVVQGQAALRQLAPVLEAPLRPRALHGPGSPLAMIGGCLLAPRVVADLSSWASSPCGRRGSSCDPSTSHAITLLMPTASGPLRLDGELVPMTDPQPEVLAITLSPRAIRALSDATGPAPQA